MENLNRLNTFLEGHKLEFREKDKCILSLYLIKVEFLKTATSKRILQAQMGSEENSIEFLRNNNPAQFF